MKPKESILNFIGGERLPSGSGQWIDHLEPRTGRPDYQLPNSTGEDVDLAVRAAHLAFPAWAAQHVRKRAGYLHKIADLLEKRADEFALAESADQGKPVRLARQMDIQRAIDNFRYFAGHLVHRTEQSSSHVNGQINYTLRSPLGVTGLISPWNLPLYLLTWKVAPALACGNTVVAKPSEFTSKTAYLLCEVMEEAELPKGVFNLVLGEGALSGQALVEHPLVSAISFTGGTVTGRRIAQAAAPSMKKLSLEMGGKNAHILFADCDFEKAVKLTVRSSFLNQGEICLCGSRVLVQEDILQDFVHAMSQEIKNLKVGDPFKEDTFMGPLVSKVHRDKVLSYLKKGEEEGGQLYSGKLNLPEELTEGYFVPPTMMVGLSPQSVCAREEIFGPVITVHPFKTEEEALQLANDTNYGLSASLFTSDLSRAHRMAEALQAGTVWVNTWLSRDLRMPFGGVKESGRGREGADHSVDFFTELKTVCVKFQEES